MKTILVPTDFSQHAENATHFAAILASKMHSYLMLLHTYHTPASYATELGPFISYDDIPLETEAALKKQVEKIRTLNPSLQVELINTEGLLVETIQNLLQEKKIDLILMGTQGAKGIEELLIGSNSAYVFEHTDCPMLIVPAQWNKRNVSRIMFATDFQFDDFKYINQLVPLAEAFDAEIIITHISANTSKASEEEELMDWFIDLAEQNITYPVVSFKIFTGDDVEAELNKSIKELNVDMISMSSVKRTFFEKMYHTSLTRKMTYHSTIPLLAFHITKPNRL